MTPHAVLWLAVSSKEQAEDEKISLPEQEKLERAYCEKLGFDVIDVLKVPGHSRFEADVITLMEDYAANDIWAYHRLREHFRARDFQLLVAFDNSRFARSQALHAYCIENVIRSGAVIQLLNGGEINKKNVHFQIALGGIAATANLATFIELRSAAMDDLAERGLPTTNRPPFSHVVIRDEKGHAIRLELDPAKRRLFDDLATLLLEGVAYNALEVEMFHRFGHADPKTGQPYVANTFASILHRPSTWGHSARHLPRHYPQMAWSFDPSVPTPTGVQVWRNAIPPVYQGDQANRVIAELMRRRRENDIILGSQSPRNTNMFAGLLICATCEHKLTRQVYDHRWTVYRCDRGFPSRRPKAMCPAPQSIGERDVIEYLDRFLTLALTVADPDVLFMRPAMSDRAVIVEQIRADLARAEEQARRLMLYLVDPRYDESRAMNEKHLAGINEQIKALKRSLMEASRPLEDSITRQNRRVALNEIAGMGLPAFWQQESRAINQALCRIFGKRRLLIQDRAIVDIVESS